MNSVFAAYFTSINPYIVISAHLPFLTGFVAWVFLYIKFDQNILKKLEWTFLRISNSAQGFTKCRVENLKAMNEVALDRAIPQFEAAWNKMMLQAEQRYTEEILPEGECFFREDVLIIIPARRSTLKSMWSTVMTLTLISILLPPTVAALMGHRISESVVTSGLFPAILLLLIHLLFATLDKRAINRTMDAYYKFLIAFDAAETMKAMTERQDSVTHCQDRLDQLNSLLTKNMKGMTDSLEKQNGSTEWSEELLDQTSILHRQEADSIKILVDRLNNLLQIMEENRVQNNQFIKDVILLSEKSGQAQQQFSSMVKEVAGMMQEAMIAGKEFAVGINQAVRDNAKAIGDITVQAQALREDYEAFFVRSGESTKLTLEEMDYQIQGLITRMSEDIGGILRTAVEKNGEILDQYKDQTTNILQSFDEQARSIALYAKEINMDIAELSNNLGVSVADFNEKMREGIQLAVGDFDSGLAELTTRIANTVENITDAVEALPASIQMANKGR